MKPSLPRVFIFFLFILLFLPFISANVYAGELENTTLRLDRQKANTATGGMVCAQTPSSNNGTETQIEVTFPQGFTVNSSASNWTVSTSDIPSNATAWPGIGTADSVSGRTVTFPSNNLSTSTYYCFNFSGSNTLTTGSTGDHKRGILATLASNGATIDYREYSLSIVGNDQIAVSATAPADPDDFETNLTLINNQSAYRQNDSLYFTLNYRSNLSHSSSITLEAEWSLGTYEGTSTPVVEILQYGDGSATDAYSNTPPVIDSINRKITWEISSFPGQASGQVTFRLETTANHTGVETVNFDVSSRIVALSTQSPDSTVTRKFIYNFSPTGAPGPSATPGTSPAPTATPIQQGSPSLSEINVGSLSENSASFTIITNEETTIRVDYGLSADRLDQRINYLNPSTSHLVIFDDLKPGTVYFFRIRISDRNGNITVSDIYSFKTASDSVAAKINFATLVFFSNNNLFTFSPEDLLAGIRPFIVVPEDSEYQFRFSLEKSGIASRIKGTLRPAETLGAESDKAIPQATQVELSEVEPGVYLGSFASLPAAGLYDLYIQIQDVAGNIIEQKLANTRIVKPFTIFSKNTLQPIENAIVKLYLYNTNKKMYNLVPASILGGKNPVNSTYSGVVPAVFSAGRYRAEINALGFKPQTVNFTIGPGEGETYPEVMLEPQPFNLIDFIAYYLGTIYDVTTQTTSYVNELSLSIRFFDLVAGVSLILFVATVIFSFSVRTHMRVRHMPIFFLYNIEDLLGITHNKYVTGEIIDSITGKPISQAKIMLYDAKTDKLLVETQSNKLGEFVMRKQEASLYRLIVEKDKFISLMIPDYLPNALSGKLKFNLQKEEGVLTLTPARVIRNGLENLVGFIFEFLLINSIILEIIFIQTRGLAKTAPFIIITLLTIIIWLFYAKRVLRRIFARK